MINVVIVVKLIEIYLPLLPSAELLLPPVTLFVTKKTSKTDYQILKYIWTVYLVLLDKLVDVLVDVDTLELKLVLVEVEIDVEVDTLQYEKAKMKS